MTPQVMVIVGLFVWLASMFDNKSFSPDENRIKSRIQSLIGSTFILAGTLQFIINQW